MLARLSVLIGVLCFVASSLADVSALRGSSKAVGVKAVCDNYVEPADFAVNADRGKIFNMLSADEIADVTTWLLANSNLNLVGWDDADLYKDNFITHVYLHEPNKAEALNYLKTGTNKPGRYAHVHLSLAGLDTPGMREYTVGPLPVGPSTVLSAPLSFGGISNIPWNARPSDTKEYDHLDTLVLDVMGQLETEMRDSYGTSYYAECPDDFCLTYSDTSPRGTERDFTLWFLFDVEAFFANPVGFYLTFELGSRKKSKHSLKMIVYNGQSFPSVSAFKTAYAANSLVKLANRPLNQVLMNAENGIDWASLVKSPNPTGVHTRRGAVTRPNSNIPAPEIQEPAGRRWKIQDGFLEYLGWTFNIGHTPISGLKLFNVRYRNESVAYEIGLSEALAVYSGSTDIVQAQTVYGDTAWGLGASANEQVLGVDCPATGELLDITFLWDGPEASVLKRTICVFEHVGQFPLRRHSNGASYGGLAANSLVVRILLPVYNYDYLVDHVFHANGAVELRAATSGYLQSTFWSPQLDAETQKYGNRIGPFTAGTTHDHVMCFKVDLDVADSTENSLVRTRTSAKKVVPADINGTPYSTYGMSALKVAGNFWTKTNEMTTVKKEAGLNLDPTTMYNVVGKTKNAWGGKRGYKIKLNGAVTNVVADSKPLRAYSFSKFHLAATLRKEDERLVSSIYDQSDSTGVIYKSVNNGQARPLVNLDRYLENQEGIENKDLVMWINVGVNHHTHAEDIPVTTMNGNTVQVFLLPMNLYDYDDSLDLGNSVYAPEGGSIDTFDLLTSDVCPMTYSELGSGYQVESSNT